MPTGPELQNWLEQQGLRILRFGQPTPDAATSSAAIGCSTSQIAKSLLFLVGDRPVLVVVAGDRKVHGSRLKRVLGASGRVRLPAPEEVFRHTGYRPGAVSPFLLPPGLPVLVDSSLADQELVYPAAGDDRSSAVLTWKQLLESCGGTVVDVSRPT